MSHLYILLRIFIYIVVFAGISIDSLANTPKDLSSATTPVSDYCDDSNTPHCNSDLCLDNSLCIQNSGLKIYILSTETPLLIKLYA